MTQSNQQSFYPKSQTQLNSLIQDYYELTLQVQTLQRHILKIQTENQQQHKFFKDETEKLKLYIDQCENEIRKREQRELILIDRLKQLEKERLDELQDPKSSRNFLKENEGLKQQYTTLVKSREIQWNEERQVLVKDNQNLMTTNVELTKRINSINVQINLLMEEKQALAEQNDQLQSQLACSKSTVVKLRHDVETIGETIENLKDKNANLSVELKQTQKILTQKEREKPAPISISSACPNCLKLSKIHEIEIEKKIRDIECLKKDVNCLMSFFELAQ